VGGAPAEAGVKCRRHAGRALEWIGFVLRMAVGWGKGGGAFGDAVLILVHVFGPPVC